MGTRGRKVQVTICRLRINIHLNKAVNEIESEIQQMELAFFTLFTFILKEVDVIFMLISLSNPSLSKNVIYLAFCKKCRRLQYVGYTTTDFRVRFRNHKSAMVTNKKTCEVVVHFNKIPHTLRGEKLNYGFRVVAMDTISWLAILTCHKLLTW